jgi:ubiquitin C-terminal hydrolase
MVKAPRKRDENEKRTWLECVISIAAGETPPVEEIQSFVQKFKACSSANVTSKAAYRKQGLKNNANACYLNSVIQALLPISILMKLLSHCQVQEDKPFYSGLHNLCRVFHSNPKSQQDVNVLLYLGEIVETWNSIGSQQDAGEFLLYMLNGVHEECKWKLDPIKEDEATVQNKMPGQWSTQGPKNKKVEVRQSGELEDSFIQRIFGGMTRSTVKTKSKESVSLEAFTMLALDISSDEVSDIKTAIGRICEEEKIPVTDGGKASTAQKYVQFKELPNVLILQLNRFTFNSATNSTCKVKKHVNFDRTFRFESDWLVNPGKNDEYSLYSVICHHGESADGGHYNALVRFNNVDPAKYDQTRDQQPYTWYLYDDMSHRPIHETEVTKHSQSAYLLIYMRKEEKVNLLSSRVMKFIEEVGLEL